MDWKKFADQINAKYEDRSDGFIGGDVILASINKDDRNEKIRIEKKTRRGYEASSHFNIEKLHLGLSIKNSNFGKARITKKTFIKRIGKKVKDQYKIEENSLIDLNQILNTKDLAYLLRYPNAEFILLDSSIQFKAQSLGKMHEEIDKIFQAITNLKNRLIE